MNDLESILTIGVYGYDEEAFFDAIVRSGTDCFCDVRRRRGLRGSTYAFANSQRLQSRLADLGIPYLHLKDLSPSPETRAIQQAIDAASGTAKRDRETFSPGFEAAYRTDVLGHPDLEASIDVLRNASRRPMLFCVERSPGACHRSILADHLAERFGIPVRHIEPGPSSGTSPEAETRPPLPSDIGSLIDPLLNLPTPTRPPHGEIPAMSPTDPTLTSLVIVAKTRMGKNLCIGAVKVNQREGTGRCLRLLPARGTMYRSWPEFAPKVGDVVRGRLSPCPQADPPHTEDHVLADGWEVAGKMKSARHFVAKFCEVWKGRREQIFGGTLRWSKAGGGRIPKGAPLPDGSVGFWELPAKATKELHNEKPKYRVDLGTESVLVPFVGDDRGQLPDVLPRGTIARMSLSRWWQPPSHEEEACWLQLSGYYLD